MSVKLNSAIFELDIPPAAKLVLLAMAYHAHADGTNCWPSITTLAKKTGLSRRGTQKLVHKLSRAGFLKDTKKVSRLGTVIYALTLDRGEPRSRAGGEPRSRGGANRETKRGRTGVPKGGEPRSPEPKTLTKDLPHAPSRSISSQQEVENENRHHHPADDDDRFPTSPEQTEAEQYNKRVDQYCEKVLPKFKGRATEEFLKAAIEIIDQRAHDNGTRIRSGAYFETALANFLEDADEVKALTDELIGKRARRERYNVPPSGFDEKEHNTEKAGLYVECVMFSVEESQRTGRPANDILPEVLAARGWHLPGHAETKGE